MIPDLGLMIWAYIMFRMIEIFCFPASRYVSKIAVCVFAILTMLFVSLMALSLLTTLLLHELPRRSVKTTEIAAAIGA